MLKFNFNFDNYTPIVLNGKTPPALITCVRVLINWIQSDVLFKEESLTVPWLDGFFRECFIGIFISNATN